MCPFIKFKKTCRRTTNFERYNALSSLETMLRDEILQAMEFFLAFMLHSLRIVWLAIMLDIDE